MIDAVYVRAVEEMPDCVYFPIHDSILLDELAKVGLRPTLGMTDYANQQESN